MNFTLKVGRPNEIPKSLPFFPDSSLFAFILVRIHLLLLDIFQNKFYQLFLIYSIPNTSVLRLQYSGTIFNETQIGRTMVLELNSFHIKYL